MKPRGDPPGVAIIGMSCRFPGAADLHTFWRNLSAGIELIVALTDEELLAAGIPRSTLRDPDYVRAASVLADIDAFDAPFFEYSPHEARVMDPQQRLLLEVAWEAFEDAGLRPGGATGVFVGCGGVVSSYLVDRLLASAELPGYTGSLSHLGNDKDFASTRISYKLNLTGPSINVQTACSTSLVAVHLACQSILSGECEMALAGASAIRVPQRIGYHSVKGGILSPDGHCRAFDAEAAGTIFGSGVGIVLLKDAQQALVDGDNIYAVIRGSAVNNDGAEKISFTASSVPGQARAMVEAMTVAGVDAGEIDYVECHGAGTAIGDPLELGALTRAFRTATDRRGYCAIGSVKSNFGHLEQCAGMAGLIKTALSIHKRSIPPSLHMRTQNPKIDFAASPFFVNTEPREWRRNGHARHAAVNSLGLGGTNAFLVLEEGPRGEPAAERAGPQLFVLSAKSEVALQATAARYVDLIGRGDDIAIADLCATAATGRCHFPHRFFAVAETTTELGDALSTLATRPAARRDEPRKLAFLFSGQASQYAGMGAELYRTEPVFRETIDRCTALFDAARRDSLTDILFGSSDPHLIGETINTQPALYAIQTALVELWRSWGIAPDAVAGHSIGEFAAAYCSGVFSLEDGFALVMKRAELMQNLPRGSMASVMADEEIVTATLNTLDCACVSVAAINAPQTTVISGETPEIIRILSALDAKGIGGQMLPVSHAFHSPMMRPAAHALRDHVMRVSASSPVIAWISTLTGMPISEAPDADYWCEQTLNKVRFRDAITALVESGIGEFIEIGPGSAMLALGRQSCDCRDSGWHASLRPGKERRAILDSLGELYRSGRDIDWDAVHRGRSRRVRLPTYAFEPHRYWLDRTSAAGAGAAHNADVLIGTPLRSATEEKIFESYCGLRRIPYLADHRIYGHPVLPLTAALVALHGAARQHFGADAVLLSGIQYRKAMVVPDDEPRVMQSVLTPLDARRADCRLASLDGDSWQTHLVARAEQVESKKADAVSIDALRARCTEEIPAHDYYELIWPLGLNYGDAFRGITAIHRGKAEVLTRVELPASETLPDTGQHPAFLDACLHIYPMLAPDFVLPTVDTAGPPAYLPIGTERFTMQTAACREAWVHAVRRSVDSEQQTLTVDITVIVDDGRIVATMDGLTLKRLPESALIGRAAQRVDDWLYRIDWAEVEVEPFPLQSSSARASWLILADTQGVATELAKLLENRGDTCRLIEAREVSDALMHADPVSSFSAFFTTAIERATRTYLPPLRGILHLWALDFATPPATAAEIDAAQRLLVGSAAALFRALSNAPPHLNASTRTWLATRNAVHTGIAEDEPAEPLAAPLWGLGRTAALEHPQLWGGLIDLDPSMPPVATADALLHEILHGHGEDQIAFRQGKRHAGRLLRAPALDASARFDPDAQYFITGGLGTVGTEVAKWLVVRHKIKQLSLVSRRGDDDPRAETIRSELEAFGAQVVIHKADVADEADMIALLDAIKTSGIPLKGVFHCAGLLDDGILAQLGWPRFAKVMTPKVIGGWLLDRLTREHPLDHFVVFSSVLSLMGSAGQANYAAANAFLDVLVDRRRSEGLPALGLNFGPWAAEGLATASGDKGRALWRARGTQYIETEQAWAAFDALIGRADGRAAITITDWPVFFRQFADIPPLYRTLAKEFAAHGRPRKSKAIADIRRKLSTAGADERGSIVTAYVRDVVVETLGVADTIDPARSLREYGLDSLMAITLINHIDTGIGIRLPMTRIVRGPSLDQLADELLSAMSPPDAAAIDIAEPIAVNAAPNGHWLTPITPHRAPKFRLFCFPFAGGGSAVFQNWAPLIRPDIELIAVEPPGRLGRIDEHPVSDIDDFVEHVVSEMQDRFDVPFAFFGHCLGGLTLYETARHLIQTKAAKPGHLFVSGARPPDRLSEQGDFERQLMRDVFELARFRIDLPAHAQPDDVFTRIIKHFNIAATDHMLQQPELRELMLPVIRAEFRLANNYIFTAEQPFDIPITCFYAQDDPYVTRSQALGWGRFTNSSFRTHIRTGTHFAVLDDMGFITSTINREFAA